MRESPSGQANPNASQFLNGITVAGNASSESVDFAIPEARIGDTASYSFSSGSVGPMCVSNIVVTTGHVVVNLFNYTANPFVINNLTLYVELIRRG